MLIDARSIAPAAEFTCDLCVVGAGPARIAIAHRLRGSSLSVFLLESGGFNLESESQVWDCWSELRRISPTYRL